MMPISSTSKLIRWNGPAKVKEIPCEVIENGKRWLSNTSIEVQAPISSQII
jgi:hypothetical protein